jgi:hypothetical protein
MKFFCQEFAVIFANGCNSLGNAVGFTDKKILSIYNIPTKLPRDYLEYWKKKQVDDVEVFAGDFTDRITEEIKPGSSYNDVTPSPKESLM